MIRVPSKQALAKSIAILCVCLLLTPALQVDAYTCRSVPIDEVFSRNENVVYGRIVNTRLVDPKDGEYGCGHYVHTLRTELPLKGNAREISVIQKKLQWYDWERGGISSIGGYQPRQLTGLLGVVAWSEGLPQIGPCTFKRFSVNPEKSCHIDDFMEAAGEPPLAPETRKNCRSNRQDPYGSESSHWLAQRIEPLSNDPDRRELERRHNSILGQLDEYRRLLESLETALVKRQRAFDRLVQNPELEFPCPLRSTRELLDGHEVVSFVEIIETSYQASKVSTADAEGVGWCGVLEHRFDVIFDFKGSGRTIPYITQVLMNCPGEDTGLLRADVDWQVAVTGHYAVVASDHYKPPVWKGCFDTYVFEARTCEITELERIGEPDAERPEHCNDPRAHHGTQLINNYASWEDWVAAEHEQRAYRLRNWRQYVQAKKAEFREEQAELVRDLASIREALGMSPSIATQGGSAAPDTHR